MADRTPTRNNVPDAAAERDAVLWEGTRQAAMLGVLCWLAFQFTLPVFFERRATPDYGYVWSSEFLLLTLATAILFPLAGYIRAAGSGGVADAVETAPNPAVTKGAGGASEAFVPGAPAEPLPACEPECAEAGYEVRNGSA